MIPTLDTIEFLAWNANLDKTTGFDYIPMNALKYEEFRLMLRKDIEKMTQNKETNTQPFFNAKLVMFNKLKNEELPTTNQLRLIACTCITQKVIETHLLKYAQNHMEKHLFPT